MAIVRPIKKVVQKNLFEKSHKNSLFYFQHAKYRHSTVNFFSKVSKAIKCENSLISFNFLNLTLVLTQITNGG